MATQHARLSKSKIMAARQCLKRLHLETHRADLKVISAVTQAAFDTGHKVGETARQIFAADGSVYLPFEAGIQFLLKKTARLLANEPEAPIFEATLQYQGVLVRIDALLPDGDRWRIVEVKASTSVKEEHVFDCAIQRWVFAGLGYPLSSISVAYVDNTFVYPGSENYDGLLREEDQTEATAALLPAVPEWVLKAREAVGPQVPEVAVGQHCGRPYDCPFIAHCWPATPEYPVQGLGGSKAKLGEFIAAGFVDVRDVPAARLTEKQKRIQSITATGAQELLPAARQQLDELPYPRYFLDFETISPAVPIWPDTRPYEVLPFQWSCHYEEKAGQLAHAEFLDLSGEPPLRRVAESLLRVLGREGPVFMYTSYEERVIRGLADRYEDLAPGLSAIIARLVDLQPIAQRNFYHPVMAGSWSLKAILPAISEDGAYSKLSGIQDGMEASEGYFEAINGATSERRKAELRRQLLAYCQFDTEAMVRLAHFLSAPS